MTSDEQRLADDKMRAEIAKLFAEIAALREQMSLQSNKLGAEVGQIKVHMIVVPFLAAAGLMGATAAVVTLFF